MTRLAIIGLGQVTRNIHLPAYKQLRQRIEIVGGCDPDPAAREQAASRGVPAVFVGAAEMIGKTRPAVVAVCSPPFLHRDHCLLALEAGCDVFCEKPFAESLHEADEIIEAAERLGRSVVVNNQFPAMKIHQAAKECIGSAEFGRLLHLHAAQTFRPTAQTEAGWRGEMPRRLCFEFGIHVFELVRFFFEDTPSRVLAHIPRPVPGASADTINLIALEFADGRSASILLDRLSKGPESYLEMRLDGEHSALQTSIGGELRLEFGLHTRARRPFFGFHVVKGGKATLHDGTRVRLLARDGINPFASATAAHLTRMLDALACGEIPPGNARDNRRTLALVFAAYDSAESGRAVALAPYLESTTEPAGLNMPTGRLK